MAKAYQFYFNPLPLRRLYNPFWKRKNPYFETYCFSPSIFYERKFGAFYLAVEMKQAKRKHKVFLKKLAQNLRRKYFQNPEILPEQAFRKTLARANILWQKHLKTLNYLPNHEAESISMAAATVEKDNTVRFSKSGDMRILLIRANEIYDLNQTKDLSSQNREKIFFNIMQGKLSKSDRIFIMNQGLFTRFQEERIFNELKDREKPKEIKKALEGFKDIFRYFSGVMLVIVLDKEKREIRAKMPKIAFPSFFSRINKIVFLIAILTILLIAGWLLF